MRASIVRRFVHINSMHVRRSLGSRYQNYDIVCRAMREENKYIHTYIHTYIDTYTYIYIYIYTYIYTYNADAFESVPRTPIHLTAGAFVDVYKMHSLGRRCFCSCF